MVSKKGSARKSKKRVLIQVDGSNFYHRLKEPPVCLENLLQFDFAKFASFLAHKGELVEAVYYVGRVRAKPNDRRAMRMMGNQQRLLARLRNQGWTTSVGFILETGGKHHEKGVDVKIAVDIVVGAYENLYDRLVLVSSDTDLLPALQIVQKGGKEIEYVGFSHAPSHAMIEHATETRLLRKDDLTPFIEKVKKK